MTDMHWHYAVIEPPNGNAGGNFQFNPEPRTRVEAKSAVLPLILLIDIGPIISLADLCQRNASLATEWLCGTGSTIEVGGYMFAVLECESGDCKQSFAAFQHMVADMWSKRDRPAAVIPHDQGRDLPESATP
ncbi:MULTISPECIES: hypothetical protein [Nocardia]|uniref:hypothetical protein n=1 Tax=Nocardia TaxID=1817 RepID=UPI0024556035|nr:MULTISPECIES: hypothetical protein [Nocardia]